MDICKVRLTQAIDDAEWHTIGALLPPLLNIRKSYVSCPLVSHDVEECAHRRDERPRQPVKVERRFGTDAATTGGTARACAEPHVAVSNRHPTAAVQVTQREGGGATINFTRCS